MPKIITTVGQRPACLVNASVTYVGNDQIYAFGGFDQYTDEGLLFRASHAVIRLTTPQFITMYSSSTSMPDNGVWSTTLATFLVCGWVSEAFLQMRIFD